MPQNSEQLIREPSPFYRWMVLLFISLAMFGNYYIYDSVAPIFDLLSSQLKFTQQQLGLLYSVYSIAAIIVLLIGGYIVDRFGTKISVLLFAVICLFAAVLTAVSGQFGIMLAGRFALGLGAEPLIVAVTTALAKWFKGKELSFAFGLNLLIARLGSVSADWSPSFARPLYTNWQDPLWLATAFAGISVAGAVLYWILENKTVRKYKVAGEEKTEKLDLKNLYKFSRSYWYVVSLCVVFYSTVFPFRAFAIKYFIEAHGISRDAGGALNSVLPLAAGVATPLFGLMVDKIGKRSFFMFIGSLILLPLFLIVTYFPPGPDISLSVPFLGNYTWPLTLLIVMLLLGVAFSMIPAIMWPSVAYIVEERRLGSGYSLMTLCQQVGMALIPWVIGFTNDLFHAGPENPGGYSPGMWIFTILASFGLIFSFLLWKEETSPHAHGLETITAKKEAKK